MPRALFIGVLSCYKPPVKPVYAINRFYQELRRLAMARLKRHKIKYAAVRRPRR